MTTATLGQKTVNIQFTPQIRDPDDWMEAFNPAFKFWDIVKVIDEGNPNPDDWVELRIVAMELYSPCWSSGSLMDAPEWRYGLRNLRGTSEIRWLTQEKIVLATYAHLVNLEGEF